jgi:putative hydrolase
MLGELIDGLQIALPGGRDEDSASTGNGGSGDRWRIPRPPSVGELREIIERARRGELLRLTLGEKRWQLVERMQAAMSLIEGHAEHTMDAVGADVLPSLPRLRAAMTRRRESRGLPWRVLERLLGLELKLRQYEIGRRFCDAVVRDGGREALARVWSGPEALPTTIELGEPSRWLERMAAPQASA